MNWEISLDRWLTTPPWDNEPDEVVVEHCAYCENDLYSGQEVVRDSIHGEYYCDTSCMEKEMFKNIEHYIEYLQPNTKRLNRFKKYLLRNWSTVQPFEQLWDNGEFTLEELEYPEPCEPDYDPEYDPYEYRY